MNFRQRIGAALGVTSLGRQTILNNLLARGSDEIATYWLQLTLAMTMATLGLALNSVGVVIAAMLVAPLMGPIVELSLSLLVGAVGVMLATLLRLAASITWVVVASMLITRMLPFNAPTQEILARTSPTLLDLFVAVCCASAAALTTARPSGASTAAGAAIGISLVPPLCVAGFGFGTGRVDLAEGALLLFTANFSAILFSCSLFYWLVGFDPLPVSAELSAAPPHYEFQAVVGRIGALVQRDVTTHFSVPRRLALPLALLAIVAVPLQRALNEVAWQVRATATAKELRDRIPALKDGVSFSTFVQRRSIALRAVIVGTDSDARVIEESVTTQLLTTTGVTADVHIVAIPSAAAIVARPDPTVIEPVTPSRMAADLVASFEDTARQRWPASAGALLDARLVLGNPAEARVAFLGEPLDATALELLEAGFRERMNLPIRVVLAPVPAIALERAPIQGQEWIAAGDKLIEAARTYQGLFVCVGTPPATRAAATVHRAIEAWKTEFGASRVRVTTGDRWLLRISATSCW